MKMNFCCFVFVAFTFSNFGNVFTAPNKSPIVPTTNQVCKDGKGPLLEGEDSPFPCADECPEGFVCEHPIEGEALGICCPNLDILYDLYGKNSAEFDDTVSSSPSTTLPPTPTPTPTTTLSTKEVREVHKFANSWQETSEVPETYTDALPLENENDKKDTPSPDSHLLKYLKAKELRLSQDKLPFHRSLPNTDAYSNPINPLNPANILQTNPEEEHGNDVTEISSTPISIPSKRNKMSIRPNCKRQKYERKCENGEKKTQIVLRWFAKNGECCSYPYGYCPGTLVKDDITLRTKEECETFCLSNATQIASSFEDGAESPFEMEINNNEITATTISSNVESLMDSEVNNSIVAEMNPNQNQYSETESNANIDTAKNISTSTVSEVSEASNASTASTTASFIELVLHNNSTASPNTKTESTTDIKLNNEATSETVSALSSASTPNTSPSSTQATEIPATTTSNLNTESTKTYDSILPQSTDTSAPPNVINSKSTKTPTSTAANIVDSDSYSNSDLPSKTNQNIASANNQNFEPLPPTPSPLFPTLANPIQGDVEDRELEEVFPPGYGPEIDENNQTHVILHSDIQEPISIAPPNEESDAHAKELISEMSEFDPLPKSAAVVAEKNSKKEENVPQLQSPPPQQQELQTSMNEPKIDAAVATKNAQNESELKVLKKPSEGIKRTLLPQKIEPKKSCLKILPYRSMCPSGMPSQFTLRWFVKAGMCCAYPFGYCHGELVFNEEAIKTKKECEELCLGRIDSEKPYHLF